MKPRIVPSCQFCGCSAELHIPGLVIDPATKRCDRCEPEWAALTGRYTDPRTITKHWRARKAARADERWAEIAAAQMPKAA